MGGPTPTPGIMYKGNRLQGRGLEAKFVVEAANVQGYTVEHIAGDIIGVGGGGGHDSRRGSVKQQQKGSKRAGGGRPAGTRKRPGGKMTLE